MSTFGWILGLLLAVVVLKLLIIWAQPILSFAPRCGATPPPTGVSAFTITTSDNVRLSGWRSAIPSEGPVFIYLCGNAGNLSDRTELLSNAISHGLAVIAINYRGTGESEGRASEQGLYRDAESVYDYAVDSLGVDHERIVAWGHSIGGAVAVHLAQQRLCAGIVFESTFRSGTVMARRMFPFLPVQWLMSYRFDTEDYVQRLSLPKLFIHGTDDQTIPPGDSKFLYERALGPKEIWLVDGADHNDVYEMGGEEFFTRIRDFGQRVAVLQLPVR